MTMLVDVKSLTKGVVVAYCLHVEEMSGGFVPCCNAVFNYSKFETACWLLPLF
ncbi:hypothetical protein PVAP13_2NG591220 [Panicum virgatum]|uniref:Uncharacterized protein n=1 Tax=Panicum virgatum TaxID=38727 RepID=A0A8T0VTP1_PANVG|nr:hypothetical protein PVAP13_2NG591220 [Panicum virgatum]